MSREITATRNFFQAIGTFFAQLGSSMTLAASAEQRFQQVQRLQAKSDAELAAMNLRREDIAAYVFRDLMHI